MEIGYSYKRYSSPAQHDNDSIRRQTALARAWCKKNGVQLDTATTYDDKAVSAFRGRNRESGVLRQFLDDIESGRIPRGSVLLIENMDRLSRQKPVIGVNLITGILLAGVRIVQLAPDELELTEDSDLFSLFRGQMSQARGHDESKTKSSRLSSFWTERKRLAREKGEIITEKLPAWITVRNGKLALIQDRVKVVKQMIRWALMGHGLSVIVGKLTEAKVPGWGRSNAWNKAYVHKILSGRAVLGEHQPRKHGKPDGDPIPNYYPALTDERTWMQVQAGLSERHDNPGPVGPKVPSLFNRLLWDARTGERILITKQTYGGKDDRRKRRVLVPAGSMEGRAAAISFPADVFEVAIRKRLKEIPLAEILGEEEESESATLTTELTAVRQRVKSIQLELSGDDDDVPAIVRSLKELHIRETDLVQRLAEAMQREANPQSAAWAEAQSLADVELSPEHRLRFRTLLRRIVDSIWVLIVPRRSHRLVAVQVNFSCGARRDYLIHYAAAGYCRPMRCETLSSSWTPKECGTGEDFDLRKREDAKLLEAFLSEMEL